ncbi:MAG: copper ABC transporter ATP-binding protein [Ignavibacteriales bacterium CG18_big_fil_WC_8_21_14_2_50_31_20]|nr:ABC transporter ATP-binding protein [Ignavibacteria bacterium]PIQ07914.1 MAG: copper ABC transporter ATP-binding protein [Ignavibacteriales bacterium CG18_big_fil_WC_8_21_14_2_50_31_20]
MIKIKNLEKYYSKLHVLKNIDLSIEQGKITYLVGPNGSGKSTLIKSILGLIKKYDGTISINGKIINEDSEYRNLIGYMPQSASFPENLTVKDIIKLVKEIRYQNIYDEELLTKFVLSKEMNKRLKNLSGGTIQKVNAALAFLFDPQILILDEPTSGLDPVSSNILKDKIIDENKKGKTILFTSHIISELEDLAQNIAFILDGKIWFSGSKNELIKIAGESNLERSVASLMTKSIA